MKYLLFVEAELEPYTEIRYTAETENLRSLFGQYI